MPKLSAGILIYRKRLTEVEVFLVHPGGPFWAKKDVGAWSIPKGEYGMGENPQQAAKREFKEETGFDAPHDPYVFLGEATYGNKILQVWAVESNFDPAKLKSNFFEMQWPPKSGTMQQFPEVDKADWFNLATARRKLVPGQVPLIDALAEHLSLSAPAAKGANPNKQLSLL